MKKVMTQAINLMFEFLKNKERISIWLYENTSLKIEGVIVGFDEYMNVVIDDADEVNIKANERTKLGRILLKGDCITLVQRVNVE